MAYDEYGHQQAPGQAAGTWVDRNGNMGRGNAGIPSGASSGGYGYKGSPEGKMQMQQMGEARMAPGFPAPMMNVGNATMGGTVAPGWNPQTNPSPWMRDQQLQHNYAANKLAALGNAPQVAPTGTMTALNGMMVPQYQNTPAGVAATRSADISQNQLLASGMAPGPYQQQQFAQGQVSGVNAANIGLTNANAGYRTEQMKMLAPGMQNQTLLAESQAENYGSQSRLRDVQAQEVPGDAAAKRGLAGAQQGKTEAETGAIAEGIPQIKAQHAQVTKDMATLQKRMDAMTAQRDKLAAKLGSTPQADEPSAGTTAAPQSQPTGGIQEGATATGPNGEKVVRKGGKWIRM